jgi:hypothetical protein
MVVRLCVEESGFFRGLGLSRILGRRISDLRRAAALFVFPVNNRFLISRRKSGVAPNFQNHFHKFFSLFRMLIAPKAHDRQTSRSAKSVFGSITAGPSATMQGVVKIGSRFAHILLFSCPQCHLPVRVVRISDLKNGEEIDGERIRFKCGFCDYAALVYGVTAKMHYVYEWD